MRKWRHFVGRTGLDWVGWLLTARRSGFVSSVPVGVYKNRPLGRREDGDCDSYEPKRPDLLFNFSLHV